MERRVSKPLVCPECGVHQMRRLPRSGFLQKKLWPGIRALPLGVPYLPQAAPCPLPRRPSSSLEPVMNFPARGVARENRGQTGVPTNGRLFVGWETRRRTKTLAIPRRGVAAATSMARFSPRPRGPQRPVVGVEPFGLGPIFPISASLVARRHPVSVASHSLISEKLAPSDTHAKVHNRL